MNKDGLVSFDEFLNGLFMATRQQAPKEPEIESPIIPVRDTDNVEVSSTPKLKPGTSPLTTPRQMVIVTILSCVL